MGSMIGVMALDVVEWQDSPVSCLCKNAFEFERCLASEERFVVDPWVVILAAGRAVRSSTLRSKMRECSLIVGDTGAMGNMALLFVREMLLLLRLMRTICGLFMLVLLLESVLPSLLGDRCKLASSVSIVNVL